MIERKIDRRSIQRDNFYCPELCMNVPLACRVCHSICYLKERKKEEKQTHTHLCMCACVLYFTHISVALFDHFDAMPWPNSVSHDRA